MEPETLRRQAAMRAAGLLFVGTLATALFYLFLAWQLGAWQMSALAAVIAAFAGLMVVTLSLIRRNRVNAAGWLMVGGMLLIFPIAGMLVANLGFVLGLSMVLLTVAVSSQTLSQQGVARTTVASVLIGTAIVLVDLFLPLSYRLDVPVLQTYIPGVTAVLVVVFAVFILREFRNYSLRAKLIIALIGITALSISAVTFITDRLSRASFVDDVGANLQTVANAQALAVNGLLSEQLSRLQTLSLSEVIRTRAAAENLDYLNLTGDETRALLREQEAEWISEPTSSPLLSGVLNDRVAEELRKFNRVFPDHSEVFLTDKYGGLIAASSRLAHYDLSNETWWQAAYNNGLGANYISQPEFDAQGNFIGVRVAVPLYTVGQQDLIGVLGALYSLEGLTDILNRGRVGETGHVHVSLPDGSEIHLVTEPDLSLRLAPARLNIDELLQAGLPYRETQLRTGALHIASQSLVTTGKTSNDAITRLGWRIAAHQDRNEALQPIETRARVTLLVGLAAVVVAGLLAFLLARVITAPITRLTATAAKVAAGDLTSQAAVESNDEIGALATTFNVMTTQLRETLDGLEQRVAERTKALRTTVEVSRRISTAMDRATLAQQVVEQLQSAFGYYHAHIYFFDVERQNLVMASGTGEAGRLMLESGHQLPSGRGLVGRAAERNQIMLVPDTARDPQWLPNPLLPDTRAEVAVPIASGERVYGVLDVQQNAVNGLTQEDADLLQALANQVAIALQNAQSFERAQQQAALEAQVNTIGQKIQSTTTVEAALQIAARELGRALDGARTRVRVRPAQNSKPVTALAEPSPQGGAVIDPNGDGASGTGG
ncbi:MAG: GAF domain-containing protein [Anaerolineales bacterium]